MLEFDGINYWAIAIAWLVNVVVGSFLYSPVALGKSWEKYTGVNMTNIPQKEASRIIQFVAQ